MSRFRMKDAPPSGGRNYFIVVLWLSPLIVLLFLLLGYPLASLLWVAVWAYAAFLWFRGHRT